MRGISSTIALVLVLVGLGATCYFVDSERPAPGVEAAGQGVRGRVRQNQRKCASRPGARPPPSSRRTPAGTVTEPIATEADPTESASLATNIASMEQTRVVDENASDLAPYGLKEPRIKVAFKAEGNISGEVFIGDTTPMQGDIYAMKPGSNKVFLVSSFIETTFNKRTFDLRDKRVVKFDRDKVDSLELTRGGDTIHLTRSGDDLGGGCADEGTRRLRHRRRPADTALDRGHGLDRRGQGRRPEGVRAGLAVHADHRRPGQQPGRAGDRPARGRHVVRARYLASAGVHRSTRR